jgi:very-short-patch-repair endonuclease
MYYLPYNKNLRDFSRYLRKNSTLSEILLWNELKNEKMLGYQFNRQKPIHRYIVDFYCKKLNLVIEIDGCSHGFEEVYLNDIKREEILKSIGLKFLRFDDMEVKLNRNNVLRVIEDYIKNFEEEKSVL